MSVQKKGIVRIDKVYTKGGDKGETSLGGGERVLKDHSCVEAFGTIDELNCIVGIVRSANLRKQTSDKRNKFDLILKNIQQKLFDLGSELATNLCAEKTHKVSITENNVVWLERIIDEMNSELKPMNSFVLPGGGELNSFLHQARTVCRRAERRIVTLDRKNKLGQWVLVYINRLSDAFFVFSRWSASQLDEPEFLWEPGQSDPEN
tara:strand:- start:301 stop:918 length:618 start_codon:yes stop_codon:yes gene_type:complete